MKYSYEVKIQKMLMHIGDLIRSLLSTVTQVYRENGINYSVFNFHEKIVRLLVPPCELLELNNQQDESEEYSQQSNQIESIIEANDQASQMLNHDPLDPNFYFMQRQRQRLEEDKNTNGIDSSNKKIFWNNPAGVQRQIKQYELSKGQLFKRSLKVLRHTKKFTENYEQYEARKQDPNRERRRKPKTIKKQQPNQQDQTQNMIRQNVNKRSGRKIEDQALQQKVLKWAQMHIATGKRVKQIDIRNQMKILSNGKCIGSTGWCSRFLRRHPEIKNWVIKRNEISFCNFQLARTEDIDYVEGQEFNWVRPGQDHGDSIPKNPEESSSIAQLQRSQAKK